MAKNTRKSLRKARSEWFKEIHEHWKQEASIVRKVIRSGVLTPEENKSLIGIVMNNFFSCRSGDLGKADKLRQELDLEVAKSEKKHKAIGIAGILCLITSASLMIIHLLKQIW